MQLQKSDTQNGSNDPWFSDEDLDLLDKAGVIDIAKQNTIVKEKASGLNQNAIQLKELMDLVNAQPQAIALKTEPIRRAVQDTRFKVDPSFGLLGMALFSTLCSVGMGLYMMNQSPNAQVLQLAAVNQQLATNSLNANAAIADRAVTEAGTSVTACLWGCGEKDVPDKSQQVESSPEFAYSQPVARQNVGSPVAVIPTGMTLNIRSSPGGQVISTIPGGDALSSPIEISGDRQWAKITWIASNMTGWVSYPVVNDLYAKL
jgi:hypothetical protein